MPGLYWPCVRVKGRAYGWFLWHSNVRGSRDWERLLFLFTFRACLDWWINNTLAFRRIHQSRNSPKGKGKSEFSFSVTGDRELCGCTVIWSSHPHKTLCHPLSIRIEREGSSTELCGNHWKRDPVRVSTQFCSWTQSYISWPLTPFLEWRNEPIESLIRVWIRFFIVKKVSMSRVRTVSTANKTMSHLMSHSTHGLANGANGRKKNIVRTTVR